MSLPWFTPKDEQRQKRPNLSSRQNLIKKLIFVIKKSNFYYSLKIDSDEQIDRPMVALLTAKVSKVLPDFRVILE